MGRSGEKDGRKWKVKVEEKERKEKKSGKQYSLGKVFKMKERHISLISRFSGGIRNGLTI